MKTRNERPDINLLYIAFSKLAQAGWQKSTVFNFSIKKQGKLIKLPLLAYQTPKAGSSLWLIAGIHGEEPAGPNALADCLDMIVELGKKLPVVIIPLCNPVGYVKNWRYFNCKKNNPDKFGLSVGDAEHVLLKGQTGQPRQSAPSSTAAAAFIDFIVKTSFKYPPILSLNFHEDDFVPEGYIYSQGSRGCHDPIAKQVVKILQANDILIKMSGRTRFQEPIVAGIVSTVQDGSVDELLSTPKIFFNGCLQDGPRAKTVLVVETPSARLALAKRKAAHSAIIKALGSILKL